jgi:hypothetical protein
VVGKHIVGLQLINRVCVNYAKLNWQNPKGKQMSKTQRIHKKADKSEKNIRVVKQGLGLLITSLIVAAFVLIFEIGKGFWLTWVIENRTQLIGVTLLALFFLILCSPIMVEFTSNPRPLSGPGKNPKGPNLP